MDSELDAFALNISGVADLVGSGTNKVSMDGVAEEGISSDFIDDLELDMTDEELLELKRGYENEAAPYIGKIEPRQKQNKQYLSGTQKQSVGINIKTVPSNMLFQATATFVPQALAQSPDPVVYSDNTPEGKQASGELKTMLQYHAKELAIRKKLGIMVWQWGVYFTACLKYGWDTSLNDISVKLRKPSNIIMDPNGYVDEFGNFVGWLGERIRTTAKELIDDFPDSKEYVEKKVGKKLGTLVTRTEWWTDEFCFTTFEEEVLEKHKNEFFNYDPEKPNHFAKPKKPYTFLSVFSLQEQPHDFTNLIEQNIANQDRVNERDKQIEKNLAHANNSLIVDDKYFNSETAHQAANALEIGDPILGNPEGIKRLEAPPLPDGVLESQNIDKETLQSIYGTQGLSSQEPNENTTARGMILNQSHDSSRIGGGVGDSLETVADNFFNWLTQLYYVFYDEAHYAAVMGRASAVEYTALMMVGHTRKFVVGVAPDSMQPKDELSQINQAIQQWQEKAIDPIGFFKAINDSDPIESAKATVLWNINPQQYYMQYFPQEAQQQQPQAGAPPQPSPPSGVGGPPEGGGFQPQNPAPLSQEPASSSLSQVTLPK